VTKDEGEQMKKADFETDREFIE